MSSSKEGQTRIPTDADDVFGSLLNADTYIIRCAKTASTMVDIKPNAPRSDFVLHSKLNISTAARTCPLFTELDMMHQILLLSDSLISQRFNLGRSEFSGRDFPVEQDIDFVKSPILEFGETEIHPDPTGETDRSPNKGGISLEIESGGVDEPWFEEIGDEADGDVEESSTGDGLVPESSGRSLGYERGISKSFDRAL